ncbi:hypothetical protein K466DRAFT_668423 [Polyporus arcularius HHB13444]|uniref:MYND-type domain-containing protein n=1 Tax=Polyporus arcularius HHB13444 TaxID=1314778 RepID=A0A5C3NQ40_9APHY|nr:hypothetical protein K466DRAFT_668423 [Polyporus arcularius HHB13444]
MNSSSDERHCAGYLCDEDEGTLKSSSEMKRCAGCRKVWYCSTACQNDHWRFHIFDCKAGQTISTVYYLARDMGNDLIPVHHQTRVDYGFEKAERMVGGNAQNKLCGLYQGLLRYLDVPCKDLRRWQKEGTLIENIKATYESRLPPQNRGGYYPWFLEHQYLLDGKPVDKEMEVRQTDGQIESMLRRGWVYAGGASSDSLERIRSGMEALPEHKRSCFQLGSALLTGTHPPPATELWLKFGFVARNDELDLAREYKELINNCAFDELCQAYETSSIPALFDRYGIREMGGRHYCFLDAMSGSPIVFKSVWVLKHYIDQLDAADPHSPPTPAPSVQCDYGYVNCKNPEEVKLLDKLYTQLLRKKARDVNPLELHAACLKGELLEFAKRFVTLAPWTAKYTRLLKNAYPLSPPPF